MKLLLNWVLWISYLWTLTTIHETAAETYAERLRKVCQNAKTLGTTPTTKAQPLRREYLDKYFESPFPGFDLFNEWFYKTLHNGTDSIYRKFMESFLDPTFSPEQVITNTPFPIPSQFQNLYSWLILQNDTIPQLIPLTEEEYMKKILDHFGGTVKPMYEDYYKWLYELSHDIKGHDKRFEAASAVPTESYIHKINNTPFPIPEDHRNYFAFICALDNAVGSTGHHYWSQSSYQTTPAGIFKKLFDQFSIHDKIDTSTHPSIHRSPTSHKLSASSVRHEGVNTPSHMTTPQGIFQRLFSQFSIEPKLKFTTLEPSEFFKGEQIDPFFWEFNDWFIKQRKEDKEWQTKFEKAKHLNLSDDKFAQSTDFPIPEKYLPYYLLENMAPYLVDDLDIGDDLMEYDHFYNWYHNASNKDIHNLERACAQVLLHNDSLSAITPFPIPEPLRKAFCWSIVHHQLINITTTPVTTRTTPPVPTTTTATPTTIATSSSPGTKMQFRFSSITTPSYQQFTAWLNRALNYGKDSLAQRLNESRRDREFDMKKVDLKTPFPIPMRYNRLYHYLEAKNRKQGIFPTSSGPPSHGDFNQWLNKALNNGATPVDQAIKDCLRDKNFNLKKITATTPFPVPLRYQRLYYWLNYRDTSRDPLAAQSHVTPAPHGDTLDHNKEQNIPLESLIFEPFKKWFDEVIKSQSNADAKLKDSFINHAFDLQKQIAEESTPFPLPEPYVRLFHWVQYENEHENQTTTSKPHSDVKSVTTHAPQSPESLFKPFHQWFDEVIKSQSNADTKLRDSFMNLAFDLQKQIAEESTPFPLPEPYVRLFHWVQYENEHKNETTTSTPHQSIKPTTPHTTLPPDSPLFKPFHKWFDTFIKSPAIADFKLKASRLDKEFNLEKEMAQETTPFPLPEPYVRLFYWVLHEDHKNKSDHQGDVNTSPQTSHITSTQPVSSTHITTIPHQTHSSKQSTHTTVATTRAKDILKEFLSPSTPTGEVLPAKDPKYQQFYSWIHSALNDSDYVAAQVKKSNYDRNFDLEKEKSAHPPPFPIPQHYERYYFWMQYQKRMPKSSTITTTHPPKTQSPIHRSTHAPASTKAHVQVTKPPTTQYTSKIVTNQQSTTALKAEDVIAYIQSNVEKWYFSNDTYSSNADNARKKKPFTSKYDDFTKWFAGLKRDRVRYGKLLQQVSRMPDKIDVEGAHVTTTPFPIPENRKKLFAYVMMLDKAVGSTDHHFWLSQNPTTAKHS